MQEGEEEAEEAEAKFLLDEDEEHQAGGASGSSQGRVRSRAGHIRRGSAVQSGSSCAPPGSCSLTGGGGAGAGDSSSSALMKRAATSLTSGGLLEMARQATWGQGLGSRSSLVRFESKVEPLTLSLEQILSANASSSSMSKARHST